MYEIQLSHDEEQAEGESVAPIDRLERRSNTDNRKGDVGNRIGARVEYLW